MFFLTVPPNFQYQNEKRRTANQRLCSMKFSMYKRFSLVEQRFLFSTEIWAEQFKKNTLYHPQLYIQKAVTSAPLLRTIFCRKQQYRYRYSTVQIRFLSAAIKRQVELDSNSVLGNWYICTADSVSRIKVEIYLGTLVNSVFCKVFQ